MEIAFPLARQPDGPRLVGSCARRRPRRALRVGPSPSGASVVPTDLEHSRSPSARSRSSMPSPERFAREQRLRMTELYVAVSDALRRSPVMTHLTRRRQPAPLPRPFYLPEVPPPRRSPSTSPRLAKLGTLGIVRERVPMSVIARHLRGRPAQPRDRPVRGRRGRRPPARSGQSDGHKLSSTLQNAAAARIGALAGAGLARPLSGALRLNELAGEYQGPDRRERRQEAKKFSGSSRPVQDVPTRGTTRSPGR